MRNISLRIAALLCVIPLLVGCSVPQITSEARTFLNLSLVYLGDYELPQTDVDGLSVGGLSGITYDRQSGTYFAVADNRDDPRGVKLAIDIDESGQTPQISNISVEGVTPLQTPLSEEGVPITLDPEGVAVAADQKWYLASEGFGSEHPPVLGTFDPATGDWTTRIPTPTKYLQQAITNEAGNSEQTAGVYPNLAFESLTISPEGDRLFAATEAPLVQDSHPESAEPQSWIRFLHYWTGVGDPYVVAEHVYPIEPPPVGTIFNGLSEILFVDNGGHFLTMERAVNPLSKTYQVKLFQTAIASATDTISIEQLPAELGDLTPIQKQSLFDLSDLDVDVQNLEGMTFGPNFVDGSRSLILMSDNGFDRNEPSQFLLFKLIQGQQYAAS